MSHEQQHLALDPCLYLYLSLYNSLSLSTYIYIYIYTYIGFSIAMPDYQRIHIDIFDTLNLRVHTSVILSLSRQERYPHPPKQPEIEIFAPGLGAMPKFLKGAGASLLGLAC